MAPRWYRVRRSAEKARYGLAVLAGVVLIVGGVVLALTQPWEGSTATGETITYRTCDVTVEGPPPPSPEAFFKPGGLTPGTILISTRRLNPPVLSIRLPGTGTAPVPGASGPDLLATGDSHVRINALTGGVLREVYRTAADEELLSGIASTARVDPLDPATAPWPYTDEAQLPVKRFETGNIEYRHPDPGAGIRISSYYGRITIPREDIGFLILDNCRSRSWIGTTTGKVLDEMSDVHADDQAAFQRFHDDVNVGMAPR
ncbi:MAG: hypothetical protein IIC86_01555 [Chloroflexi bacterium]|nr:hypothetical protein [Chloroflexota bacterium]